MDEEEFASLADLRTAVEQAGDVKTVSMWTLREAYGAGRLGIHVRANISDSLRSHGLGHYPATLPEYQQDLVRVYVMGTPTGDLIEAVFHLSKGADRVIRERAGGDADALLKQVRELVCE